MNLIIDLIPLGFASSDINPLFKVIFHDSKDPSKLSHINKNMSITMPNFHKEVVLRYYNTDPSRQEMEKQDWENIYEKNI